MKLVGIVENINQKGNENLIGQIVIVDSKLTHDSIFELCYQEEEDYGRFGERYIIQLFGLMHSVSNIEIIGVL